MKKDTERAFAFLKRLLHVFLADTTGIHSICYFPFYPSAYLLSSPSPSFSLLSGWQYLSIWLKHLSSNISLFSNPGFCVASWCFVYSVSLRDRWDSTAFILHCLICPFDSLCFLFGLTALKSMHNLIRESYIQASATIGCVLIHIVKDLWVICEDTQEIATPQCHQKN